MNKQKNASPSRPTTEDATSAQVNELYTAHQVHTLAQMTYRHLMAGWNRMAGMPAMPAMGVPFMGPGNGMAWPHAGMAPMQPAHGFMPTGPQSVVYWYP